MSRQPTQKKSDRFLGASVERWEIWSNAVTTAGVIIAFIAGCWCIFEYFQNQEDDRKAYTFRVIDSWDRQGYKASYSDLRELYTAFLEKLPREQREMAAANETARQNVIGVFNASLTPTDATRQKIRDVAYFFNKLNLCIDADLCSDDTAAIFFNDTVKSFLEVFGPYLKANDGDLPGGQSTLEALSARLN